MNEEKTFRDVYCAKRAILPAEFEETIFWECFPPNLVKVGRFMWLVNRQYFANDFELVHEVADCATMEELTTELANFRSEVPEQGFLRVKLGLRLSGQRLVDLASTVLPSQSTSE